MRCWPTLAQDGTAHILCYKSKNVRNSEAYTNPSLSHIGKPSIAPLSPCFRGFFQRATKFCWFPNGFGINQGLSSLVLLPSLLAKLVAGRSQELFSDIFKCRNPL